MYEAILALAILIVLMYLEYKGWIPGLVVGIFAFIMLIILVDKVDAADYYHHEVEVHIATYHFNRDAGYNERNWGGIYRYNPVHNFGFQIGTYKNSDYRQSGVVGVHRRWSLSKHWTFTLNGGIVTNYERAPVLPYVLPQFTYKGILNLYIMPLGKNYGGVASSLTILRR